MDIVDDNGRLVPDTGKHSLLLFLQLCHACLSYTCSETRIKLNSRIYHGHARARDPPQEATSKCTSHTASGLLPGPCSEATGGQGVRTACQGDERIKNVALLEDSA